MLSMIGGTLVVYGDRPLLVVHLRKMVGVLRRDPVVTTNHAEGHSVVVLIMQISMSAAASELPGSKIL